MVAAQVAQRSQRIGLTAAIFLSFAFALVLLLLALFIVVPMQANDYLTDTLWERGKAVAREIERKLDIEARVLSGAREFDEKASAQIDFIVRGEEEISGVWVLVCGVYPAGRSLVRLMSMLMLPPRGE